MLFKDPVEFAIVAGLLVVIGVFLKDTLFNRPKALERTLAAHREEVRVELEQYRAEWKQELRTALETFKSRCEENRKACGGPEWMRKLLENHSASLTNVDKKMDILIALLQSKEIIGPLQTEKGVG